MSTPEPAFLRRELARFDPTAAIERAWTPPASWYTAPEFDALERSAVFLGSWQPVARLETLRQPGDYTSGCLAGEPWLVLRDETGRLRAFHNTCRHKGREVVQGSGRVSELVCGYHAWCYDLGGHLRRAPRMGGVQDFDRQAMSLRELPLETWGAWAFLNIGGGAPPLGPALAELEKRMGGGWERLYYVRGATWTLECNWKVYVDNYLDGGYHIPHMHPSLDAQIDMERYRTEVFERFSIQSTPPSSETDDSLGYDAGQRIGGEALYAWLWPNFMLNRYGPCLDTNWVLPEGPDRCQVHYEFWFEDPSQSEFIEQSIEQSAVTQREDIAICESVQLGLRSEGYDRGRYAPRVETGEHHFHRLLAQCFSRALEPGPTLARGSASVPPPR